MFHNHDPCHCQARQDPKHANAVFTRENEQGGQDQIEMLFDREGPKMDRVPRAGNVTRDSQPEVADHEERVKNSAKAAGKLVAKGESEVAEQEDYAAGEIRKNLRV